MTCEYSDVDAHGQLITAYANASAPSLELLHPGRDPLVFSDLVRKIHRADVGRDTVDQLTVITEQLCCEYACRPPTSYCWAVFQCVAGRLRPEAFLPHRIDVRLCSHGSVMSRPKEPFDVVPPARTG